MSPLLPALLLGLLPGAALAQDLSPSTFETRLTFHAASAYGPWALLGSAAYAGIEQGFEYPREWGQGGAGYGKRLGSTLAYSGVRNAMGLGLDAALHQDPRYLRSADPRFWKRMGHVIGGTVLTRTDSGKPVFATWRFGSAYGATFLSNEWYPDRLNTVKLGFAQGTAQIGFDLLGNLGREFLPDVRRSLHRR